MLLLCSSKPLRYHKTVSRLELSTNVTRLLTNKLKTHAIRRVYNFNATDYPMNETGTDRRLEARCIILEVSLSTGCTQNTGKLQTFITRRGHVHFQLMLLATLSVRTYPHENSAVRNKR